MSSRRRDYDKREDKAGSAALLTGVALAPNQMWVKRGGEYTSGVERDLSRGL